MAAPTLDPFDGRITAVFLAEHWNDYLDFMSRHGIDELRCEDIVRTLEGEEHGHPRPA